MITVKDEKGHSQVWPSTPENLFRQQRRIDKILSSLPPHSQVLELGCGYGELTYHLLAQGHSVTAIDRSDLMLEATGVRCRGFDNLTLVKSEILDFLIERSREYDAVIGMGILHHCVHDLEQTLRLISSHLVPGGRGLFWEPNRQNPIVKFIFGTAMGRKLLSLEKMEDAFPRRKILPLLEKHFAKSSVTTSDWAYPFMSLSIQKFMIECETQAPGFLRDLIAQSLWIEFYKSSDLVAKIDSPK